MKLPKVSVVIPTYTRSNKLRITLTALEKSGYPWKNLDILVVDDCSVDNTREVVEEMAKKYKNISYYKTKTNSGPATARNIGIKNARGGYILFIDDDCLVPKNLFREYVGFLEENKQVMGVGGGIRPASNNIIAKIEVIKDKILGIGTKRREIGRNLMVGFTGNMMYRRRIFRIVGVFNEKFKIPAGEDIELRDRITKNYDLASLPVYVVHNHDYNIDYLLAAIIKQGMDKTPPKTRFKKISVLIFYSPWMVYNIIRKVLKYRLKKN